MDHVWATLAIRHLDDKLIEDDGDLGKLFAGMNTAVLDDKPHSVLQRLDCVGKIGLVTAGAVAATAREVEQRTA